jgi:cytosine/adenosine deaminase-related metal-dependent hydrolase
MKKEGIPVCLGTDSLASNRSLSMFREMRLFRKEFPGVTAMEALSLATVKAAQALGMGGQLGQIKPGCLADIIGIPMTHGSSRQNDPAEQVVAYRDKVSFSMVHGEPRLRLTS